MLVSFIVVAYNAETKLVKLLDDLKKQNYDHEMIEVILVDSNSSDRTRQVMTDFANSDHDFRRVCVLDNPKKILPAGWNVALKECQGDIILRVDAHASIPEDFIRKNVECIKLGESICGGQRKSIIEQNTKWQRTLLFVESSLFGSGIAGYRHENAKRYVKTLAHAAYRREVFQTVGPYNEALVRTEDNEMHYRMRQAGYKFCFDPSIVSYHHARNSFPKMLKQKYLNGYWIGRSLRTCPKAFSWYHFAPACFVGATILSAMIGVWGSTWPLKLLLGTYGLGALMITVLSLIRERSLFQLVLPILFLLLHFSYGIGTFVGIISLLWPVKNDFKTSAIRLISD